MNVTEKNYSINRAFKIVAQKCHDIVDQEAANRSKVRKALQVSQRNLVAMIQNKELVPKANSKLSADCEIDITSSGISLEDLFDFKPLKKQIKKSLRDAGIDPNRTRSWNAERFTLKHPTSKAEETFHSFAKATTKRFEKAQALLLSTSDNIMLGSNEEAIAALKDLEAITI